MCGVSGVILDGEVNFLDKRENYSLHFWSRVRRDEV